MKIDFNDLPGLLEAIRRDNRFSWDEMAKEAQLNHHTLRGWRTRRGATGKNFQKMIDNLGYRMIVGGREFRFDEAADWLDEEAYRRHMSRYEFEDWLGFSESYIASVKNTSIAIKSFQYIVDTCDLEIQLVKIQRDSGFFWCPVCGNKTAVWQSKFDSEKVGYSRPGVVHMYTCATCSAEIEAAVMEDEDEDN